MGDVSWNQPINAVQLRSSTAKQDDQIRDLTSVGWTNESHSLYISSMEASFMQQLRGHEHHRPATNKSHVGGQVIQEGVSDNLKFERNDARLCDVSISSLPKNPWIRRFRPHTSGVNRRGDGVGASVDDGESGTDTVQQRVRTHGREVKSCVGEKLADKSTEVSDQNFPDEEGKAIAAPSKTCKKRRPAPSTAAGCSMLKLACSEKRSC